MSPKKEVTSTIFAAISIDNEHRELLETRPDPSFFEPSMTTELNIPHRMVLVRKLCNFFVRKLSSSRSCIGEEDGGNKLWHTRFPMTRVTSLHKVTRAHTNLCCVTTPLSSGLGSFCVSKCHAPSKTRRYVAIRCDETIGKHYWIWMFVAALIVGATPDQRHSSAEMAGDN